VYCLTATVAGAGEPSAVAWAGEAPVRPQSSTWRRGEH
jgi:hypothetical protein